MVADVCVDRHQPVDRGAIGDEVVGARPAASVCLDETSRFAPPRAMGFELGERDVEPAEIAWRFI